MHKSSAQEVINAQKWYNGADVRNNTQFNSVLSGSVYLGTFLFTLKTKWP